ncbi:MAG: zf-HC2 domain-containing protein [Acidobacteria bacterium]|nr:zf-HC2 domain-containing protein [Candidatus Sulfomarinibacter sp. MAG AM2]
MMLSCTDVRDLFSLYLDGELEEEKACAVRDHLAECSECTELTETMELIAGAGAALAGVEPPDHLAGDLQASPCRRWMGLLFQAVDREISQHNLERLLTHLEACPSCRRAWQDLTLIHQVSEAMEPPPHLVNLCIRAREKRPGVRPILNRRLATAAAYLLAVLTSLIIGNPVTLARSQAVANVVTAEVSDVAEQGRGEARIMLWRAWKWGERKVEAVRDFVSKSDEQDDSTADSTVGNEGESK